MTLNHPLTCRHILLTAFFQLLVTTKDNPADSLFQFAVSHNCQNQQIAGSFQTPKIATWRTYVALVGQAKRCYRYNPRKCWET